MILEKSSDLYQLVSSVVDPEVPVLTIEDLGVLRNVENTNGRIIVTITPTYVGCPAMELFTMNIKSLLMESGYQDVEIDLVLSPAWSSDWISEEGKRKLKEYGIAPPAGKASRIAAMMDEVQISCPHCDSTDTEVISEFGSTACKSLYRCKSCLEPFDYFKCH